MNLRFLKWITAATFLHFILGELIRPEIIAHASTKSRDPNTLMHIYIIIDTDAAIRQRLDSAVNSAFWRQPCNQMHIRCPFFSCQRD